MKFLKHLFKKPITLYFHMKSGKTIAIMGVDEYTLKFNGNDLTSYSIEFRRPADRTLLYLRIDEVESVTRSAP